MYQKYFKRLIDITCSLLALIVLSPIMIILIILGAVAMKGNPFFVQLRPGKIDKKTGIIAFLNISFISSPKKVYTHFINYFVE